MIYMVVFLSCIVIHMIICVPDLYIYSHVYFVLLSCIVPCQAVICASIDEAIRKGVHKKVKLILHLWNLFILCNLVFEVNDHCFSQSNNLKCTKISIYLT